MKRNEDSEVSAGMINQSCCLDPISKTANMEHELLNGLREIIVGAPPVNEFEKLHEILLGAFPCCIFRCPQKVTSDKIQIELTRRGSRVAKCSPLLFALFDMQRRHQCARVTAAAVKAKSESMAYIKGMFDDPV